MSIKSFSIFLFFFFFTSAGAWNVNNAEANVKVSKMNEIVDWNKASNYAEAQQMMQMAKEINRDKRRRKQLRDAGVPEDEIKKIMRNEKNVANNNNVLQAKQQQSNHFDTNGDNESEDEDGESDIKFEVAGDNDKRKLIGDSDNVNIKPSKQDISHKTIINDYDTYGNTEKNNSIQFTTNKELTGKVARNEREVIDLSIIPQVPTLENVGNNDVKNTVGANSYNDFEFSRMLHKAGENVNNPQAFAVFAKEAEKIANKTKLNNELLIPNIEEYIYDDEFYAKSARRDGFYAKNDARQDNLGYFYKKKQQTHRDNNGKYKTGKYKTNLHNLYATAQEEFNKKNSSTTRKDVNQSTTRYAMDDEHSVDNNDILSKEIMVNADKISQKQIDAKNIGAPYPTKRADTNHLKQYQPQNIAQIAYDKNNKHLQPIVFEKHIIDQVFDNLGSDNAVPLARTLINKFGKTDIADDDGNTLLMHAVARKNQSLIAMLLAEGASPNVLNKEGFAPIHLATSNGDNTAVHSLMMSGGDPNLMDNSGNTPLMYASKMCDSSSIKMMMALGGDPSVINKSTGKTAMDFAYENENPMAHELLEIEMKKLSNKRKPVNLVH